MNNNNTTTTITTTDIVGNMPTTVISAQETVAAPVAVAFNRAAFITQFNTTGAPKQRKVPCTITGQMITIFGANLRNRVTQFGSVEAFLDGFVSRKAASKKFKNNQA